MKEAEDIFDELAGVCLEYLEGEISKPIFEVMVEGLAGRRTEPLRSKLFRAAEKSVGEHHCFFWHDCRTGFCVYDGLLDEWEELFKEAPVLWPLIESEGVN